MKIRLGLMWLVRWLPLLALLVQSGCCRPEDTHITQFGPAASGTEPTQIRVGENIRFVADVYNPCNLEITFVWSAQRGYMDAAASNKSPVRTYVADEEGQDLLTVAIYNGNSKLDEASWRIEVSEPPPPPCATASRSPLPDKGHLAGSVSIDSPRDGQTDLPTENLIEISGTAKGVAEGIEIWVMLYPMPQSAGLYYPQAVGGKGSQVGSDGTWSIPAKLGKAGECYEIVVVLADPTASAQLHLRWREWETAQSWKGLSLDDLPGLVSEKAAITVQSAK